MYHKNIYNVRNGGFSSGKKAIYIEIFKESDEIFFEKVRSAGTEHGNQHTKVIILTFRLYLCSYSMYFFVWYC